MARETVYLVQGFKTGKGARLIADTPILCKSAGAARRKAETLATTKAGVAAFATSGDADLGEYDEEPVDHLKGRPPAAASRGGVRRSIVTTGSDADGRGHSDDA